MIGPEGQPIRSHASPTRHPSGPLPFAGVTSLKETRRLKRQVRDVWRIMRDCQWHTLSELSQKTGATTASVSARVRDLRKPRFGSHEVVKRKVEGTAYYEYRVLPRTQHAESEGEVVA